MKKMFILIIMVMLPVISGFPQPPCQFYGSVTRNNEILPPGTLLQVFDSDRMLCGEYMIEDDGKYIISCKGDDLSTENDEGALPGEEVQFYVDGVKANTSVKVFWSSGQFVAVDLAFQDVRQEGESHITVFQESFTYALSQKRDTVKILLGLAIFLVLLLFVIYVNDTRWVKRW